MIDIKFKDDDAILTFPKKIVSSKYVQDFLDRLKLESIAQKSQLTEEKAWELSEELKQKWWDENKHRFLDRIKIEESSCG
ncbi:MAG TPA: hypothetical protein VJL89_02525 [Thermodesulfovibrionia bacterium]|nr:hypothetical protein [Thermodesulfovibrionia bacterium]